MSLLHIDEENIKSLQSTYDCEINLLSDPSTKEQFLAIVYGKSVKLQICYDESKQPTVNIVDSGVFESAVVKELEDKMNQFIRKSSNQSDFIGQTRFILDLLKNSWSKRTLHLKNNETEKSAESSSKPVLLETDRVPKSSKSNRKITLAANFSIPLSSNLHTKSTSSSNTQKTSKKPPMKTAQDVINRIKWDESLKMDMFTVAYTDRFVGIVEKGFSEFDWDNDIASVGPEVLSVPQHRIQYFKYGDKVIWKKDDRLDDVFGSTGGKNIHDVIKLYELALLKQEQKKSEKLDASDVNSPQPCEISNPDAAGSSNETPLSPLQEEKPSRGRTRPNYFIAFRVNDPDVASNVSSYLEQLNQVALSPQDREILSKSMTSVEKLHVTFCVCYLESEEDIEKTKQVLAQTYVESDSLNVEIRGIGHFDQAVVFAQIHSKHLRYVQERLMNELAQQNINLKGNYDAYHPHMTLVKLPKKHQNLYKKYEKFVCGKKSKRYKFARGQYKIDDILLCKIGSTDKDNFYKTIASYPIKCSRNDNPSAKQDSPRASENKRERGHSKKDSDHASSQDEPNAALKRQQRFDVRLGKSLSAVLRHNKFGFRVDSDGYVEMESILRHQQFSKMPATKEDVYRVVENNDKQRFTITTDELGVERIKANQGHSVEVEDPTLKEITDPSLYPTVIHGTFWPAWKSIKREGLHHKKRIHIHMTTAEPSESSHVISGMRSSCTVFIYVDLAAALRDGIKFYVSTNGVILSRGNERGFLKPKYFQKVVGMFGGKRQSIFDDFAIHPKKKHRKENRAEDKTSTESVRDASADPPTSSTRRKKKKIDSASKARSSNTTLLTTTESSDEDESTGQSEGDLSTAVEDPSSENVSSAANSSFQDSEDTSNIENEITNGEESTEQSSSSDTTT